MNPEKLIGYILFLLLFGSAIGINAIVLPDVKLWYCFRIFIDFPSILLVMGGTFAITIMSGGIFKMETNQIAKQYQWQVITLGLVVTSLIGMMIGLIRVLTNIDDPGSIGPGTATSILSFVVAGIILALIAFPMEDRYYKMNKNYREMSLSRIAWYGYPLVVVLFCALSLVILYFSIQFAELT